MPVRLFCSFPSYTGVDGHGPHGKPSPHSSEIDNDSIFWVHSIGVVFTVRSTYDLQQHSMN